MNKEEIRESIRKTYRKACRREPSEWFLGEMVRIIAKRRKGGLSGKASN